MRLRNEKINFSYLDSKLKTTHDRLALVISPASDSYLCIDVTEYAKEDQEYYMREVEEAYKVFLQNVQDIGCASNWRRFKEKGIFNCGDV